MSILISLSKIWAKTMHIIHDKIRLSNKTRSWLPESFSWWGRVKNHKKCKTSSRRDTAIVKNNVRQPPSMEHSWASISATYTFS